MRRNRDYVWESLSKQSFFCYVVINLCLFISYQEKTIVLIRNPIDI